MRKILVIRLSSLGDVILTSPAVANLRLRYPEAQIDYLTKPTYSAVASAIPGVDNTLTLPSTSGLAGIIEYAGKLEDSRYDLIVDLHNNLRSRLLRSLGAANQVVSIKKKRIRRELITRFQRTDYAVPQAIDSANLTLRAIDPEILLAASMPRVNSDFGTSDIPEVIREWLESGKSIVACAPGARHETKRAPLQLFTKILEEVGEDPEVCLLNIYRSQEGALSLKGVLPDERYFEVVDGNLERVACVLRLASVALTNDSGIMHLASALNTPVVALFGPTHPALGFSPAGADDLVVEVDEPCRPCSVHGARDCHRSERYCFTRISSVAASEALRAQLSRRKSARRALFLDRDGTIIREKGFLSDPDGVETLPRVSAALRRAREAGYALVVVSNQSGVARGLFSEKSVHAVNDRVKRELEAGGVELDGMYYSPTHPRGAVDRYRTKDGTRKPSDKMFVQAARELNLDLRNSWVIGDRPSDFLSAWTIGASGALVRSGYGAEWEPKLAQFGPLKPHLIADDLSTAISIILDERG